METQVIIAQTIAVLSNPNGTVVCYVEVNDESANLTLNLHNDKARIFGYPDAWKIWDEIIDGDLEARTYEEAFNNPEIESFVHEIESIDTYVSKATEKEIFRQLRIALKSQFEDADFKDELNDSEKEEVFQKIDRAISLL